MKRLKDILYDRPLLKESITNFWGVDLNQLSYAVTRELEVKQCLDRSTNHIYLSKSPKAERLFACRRFTETSERLVERDNNELWQLVERDKTSILFDSLNISITDTEFDEINSIYKYMNYTK